MKRSKAKERGGKPRSLKRGGGEKRTSQDKLKWREGAKTPAELGIKLVALRESDDIEAYLVTFERIMAAHKIERWPEQRSSATTARKKMEEDARTEQKEKQSGARPKPVVEQGDKDVAKENGVQLKSRLDNAAVLHEAEGLVVSKAVGDPRRE
ncbi:hypothetical protein EMCRGX_G000601 [Ephydatia muelleri]